MNTRNIRIDRCIYIFMCYIMPNNIMTYAITLSVILYIYMYIRIYATTTTLVFIHSFLLYIISAN